MKWIIDTDPGVDDAAAIIAAEKGLDVLAWSVVHGNVDLDKALQNALFLKDLLETETPVFSGAESPLLEKRINAASVHGEDGLGDLDRPAVISRPENEHAVDMILEKSRTYPGEVGLLTLGPLTNIALALGKDRGLVERIGRVVIMGGTSTGRGNTTPVGEFNFAADPEAAAMVLRSGMEITLVPWEPTVEILFPLSELEGKLGTGKLARTFLAMCEPFAAFIEKRMGRKGIILSDLVAAAVAIDPQTLLKGANVFAAVETAGQWGRGLTAIDFAGVSGQKPNIKLCLEADRKRVLDILVEGLS